MTHICHITTVHDANDIRIFQKECVSLAQTADFSVSLIAPGQNETIRGVRHIGLGKRPASRRERMLQYGKKARLLAIQANADIYHLHDPELLPLALVLKRRGKAVVFDSHELTHRQILLKPYLPSPVRALIAGIYYAYETFVCRRIDAVIFPCPVDGQNPFAHRSKNTILLDNLPLLAEFSAPPDLPKQYDVGQIGSLSEDRGIVPFLQATRRIGASVLLGGDFSPPDLKMRLAEQGLMDHVRYVGRTTREQTKACLAQCRIGASTILPRGQYHHLYNLPTKVYECMASGLPVVISNFPHVLNTLREHPFGLAVDPESADDIAAAIQTLLNDPKKAQAMGQAGRRAVESDYHWEKEAQKLIALYRRLL